MNPHVQPNAWVAPDLICQKWCLSVMLTQKPVSLPDWPFLISVTSVQKPWGHLQIVFPYSGLPSNPVYSISIIFLTPSKEAKLLYHYFITLVRTHAQPISSVLCWSHSFEIGLLPPVSLSSSLTAYVSHSEFIFSKHNFPLPSVLLPCSQESLCPKRFSLVGAGLSSPCIHAYVTTLPPRTLLPSRKPHSGYVISPLLWEISVPLSLPCPFLTLEVYYLPLLRSPITASFYKYKLSHWTVNIF